MWWYEYYCQLLSITAFFAMTDRMILLIWGKLIERWFFLSFCYILCSWRSFSNCKTRGIEWIFIRFFDVDASKMLFCFVLTFFLAVRWMSSCLLNSMLTNVLITLWILTLCYVFVVTSAGTIRHFYPNSLIWKILWTFLLTLMLPLILFYLDTLLHFRVTTVLLFDNYTKTHDIVFMSRNFSSYVNENTYVKFMIC